MVNTEIRLIIFFAAKDGEALYSQQKQDRGADCGSDRMAGEGPFTITYSKARHATPIITNVANRKPKILSKTRRILFRFARF